MKTSVSHLPPHKQAELDKIVKALIPQFKDIEMVILYGSYARGTWVEDKYVENGNTYEYKSDYDLLVIVNKNSQANADNFVSSVTGKLEELKLDTPVHPIFHGIDFVNEALREGNYFFDDIKKEGILLFNTSRYPLDKKREMTPAEVAQRAQEDFDQWFESANMFYENFEANYAKGTGNIKYYNVAAFELHQATERFYGALQLVFTGYKPKTHDIEVLGWLAKAINIEFGKVFPKATLSERVRFSQLRRAYVDARYKADYKISKEDLEYLSGRVELLRTMTEKYCKEKIAGFTK
ncbi:MAG: polymerase beta domain protein region [Bacteroidetes bacterium]|jgi:predicted nucleotidyltransferase/HEPN domain-containing protein|nr:polymerase beta domain protein region [Bacteroidota bacterium]